MPRFADRADAAERLIAMLPAEIGPDWLVLGLARGGVPIAAALARHIGAELGVIIVCKVGAPGSQELAIAAITGPEETQWATNEPLVHRLGLSHAEMRKRAAPAIAEVARRRAAWTGAGTGPSPTGRNVLVVDDGIATGTTAAAAIKTLRQQGAARIVLAVPVALGSALDQFREQDIEILCPYPDTPLSAVGAAYARFDQVADQVVQDLLAENAKERVRHNS